MSTIHTNWCLHLTDEQTERLQGALARDDIYGDQEIVKVVGEAVENGGLRTEEATRLIWGQRPLPPPALTKAGTPRQRARGRRTAGRIGEAVYAALPSPNQRAAVAVPEIAERTGLTATQVRSALQRLREDKRAFCVDTDERNSGLWERMRSEEN